MAPRPARGALALSLLGVAGALWQEVDLGRVALDDAPPLKYRQEMVNYMDLQYYGHLNIGRQTIKGVFDTGSVELVVLSEKCREWCGGNKTLYQSAGSKTYRTGGLSLVLAYGSGSLKAREAYESVSVGPLSAAVAPFWEVYDASMPLLFNSNFEAIVGLGPIPDNALVMEPGSSTNEEAFAVLLKKLRVGSFSLCLGQDPGSSGFLTWNDDVAKRHKHMFFEVQIPDTGYWMIELSGVRLGDTRIGCFEQTCGAVLDSGTSLLALPRDAHDTLTGAIAKLDLDCSDLENLPDLYFRLNGVEFALPADSYLGQVFGEAPDAMSRHFALWGLGPNRSATSSSDSLAKSAATAASSARCQASLMRIAMESPMGQVWILGMPFFRRFYTVFVQATADQGPSIHMAPAGEKCHPVAKGGKLITRRRAKAARLIDASKLRMPPWLRRAQDSRRM